MPLHGREVVAGEAAPLERALVGFDRRAVQLDRAEERGARYRNDAHLVRVAQQEDVGAERVPEKVGDDARGVEEARGAGADQVAHAFLHRGPRRRKVRVLDEGDRRHAVGVDDRARDAFLHAGEDRVLGGDEEVAADDRVRLAGGDADRGQVLRRGSDLARTS